MNKKDTFSNILINSKFVHVLNNSMIITKTLIGTKKDGTPVYDLKLNSEFCKNIPKPSDCVIDEVHNIMNPRRSMSKVNVIVSDWLALLRRCLNSKDEEGELVLITQIFMRVDSIARELATEIRYHIGHYFKYCEKCQNYFYENTEMADIKKICFICGYNHLKKRNHQTEILFFNSSQHYLQWLCGAGVRPYKRYLVRDLHKYWNLYNTLQWENLINDMY